MTKRICHDDKNPAELELQSGIRHLWIVDQLLIETTRRHEAVEVLAVDADVEFLLRQREARAHDWDGGDRVTCERLTEPTERIIGSIALALFALKALGNNYIARNKFCLD